MTEEPKLSSTLLCTVDIKLEDDAPWTLGQSPWHNRRVSNIAGGHFEGPKMRGSVLPSGADWSEGGYDADGNVTTALDIRSVWRADDGAMIYVTYNGRLVISPDLIDTFRSPEKVEGLDPSSYYFRINPLFETSSDTHSWLNNIVCIGKGQRTRTGIIYQIFQIE
jgi:hypothetical protein